jgi:hypothetical protein
MFPQPLLHPVAPGFALIERNDWGPRLVFGRLYEWLAHESDDAAYEPLRDIIRRHVIETMPLGPGDDVFGREVTVRRLHSVRSASLEMDVHPKRPPRLGRRAGTSSDGIAMGVVRPSLSAVPPARSNEV